MRVNARLDDESTNKLEYLARATSASASDVIREAIRRYYAAVHDAAPATYALFEESGFLGCAEGPPDLSSTYKASLGQTLEHKHGHR